MTDRQAPTPYEIVTTVDAALDQAESEIRHLRAHVAAIRQLALGDDTAEQAAITGLAHCGARSAAVVSCTVGEVADQLRDLARRQSGSTVV